MSGVTISAGFIPLLDAAPLIVAHEMGFAAEEGIALDLRTAPSWSSLRDMLSFGQIDAAHMLSAVPVAAAMGLGGAGTRLAAVSVLSVGGNVIGVSRAVADELRAKGHDFAFNDPVSAGRAVLGAAGGKLRIGVPFPFSMHAALVGYWLERVGLGEEQALDIRTIPPALMANAIAADEIDAFCVGEPWGSRAVAQGVGALILPSAAIWAHAPEKVLAVREEWAETERALLHRLIRAIWQAGRWLSLPEKTSLAAELLARKDYLDLPVEMIEGALRGDLQITPEGESRSVERFMMFSDGATNFPWRSQAEWIARRLAERAGRDVIMAQHAARQVFRPDLFRDAMASTGIDLPGASSKLEGALQADTAVASAEGRVILHRDAFFDGSVFEPLP